MHGAYDSASAATGEIVPLAEDRARLDKIRAIVYIAFAARLASRDDNGVPAHGRIVEPERRHVETGASPRCARLRASGPPGVFVTPLPLRPFSSAHR
jgi:hypothetical protein